MYDPAVMDDVAPAPPPSSPSPPDESGESTGADPAAPAPRLLLSRRRAIKLGVVASIGGVAGVLRLGFHDTAGVDDLEHLSAGGGSVLRSVVDTVLPPDANRSREKLTEHVRFIDGYLVGMDPADLAQLGWLLFGLEHGTILAGKLRRFTRLPPADRADVLQEWRTSSIGLRRLGYRSLAALGILAFYRDDEAFATIGYPGPLMREGWVGPAEAAARYDALLAPADAEPGSAA